MQQVATTPLSKINSYQNDLLLAADFQQAVLPEVINVDYLDIALFYQPYDTVSGDVYDFILNLVRELGIFVGDATGHGIAAALMTMMVHIAIDSLTPNLSTDEYLRKLNRLIASRNTGRSVSSVLLRITPNGSMNVAHAGHPSLIIAPADGSELIMFEEAGCALGLFADEPVKYVEENYQLQNDDKLIAYTDGLLEWRNDQKQSYGMPRLLDCIANNRKQDCHRLKDSIVEDVISFSNQKEADDDLTLLVMQYTS